MSKTQELMKAEMESLIEAAIKHASEPTLKRLEDSTTTFKEATGDRNKLQGMVNLQKVQYEDILVNGGGHHEV